MRPTVVTGGKVTEYLPVGEVARALNRSVGRVRALEVAGILPPAHKRRRVAGHRGWRLYDASYVAELEAIAVEEAIVRRRRVDDWSAFSARAWAAYNQEPAAPAASARLDGSSGAS